MSQPTIILLQTPQNPNFFTLFPKFTFPRKLSLFPQTLKLSPYDSIPTSITPYSLSSSSSSSSLQPNYKEEPDEGEEEEEDEELVIGDCVVFEEGIFQDPYLEHDFHLSATTNPRKTEIKPENLIPHEWKQVQAEVNITKKERREIAQKWEFGRRLEKRRLAMEPIGLESGSVEERMRKYRDAKLAQLKPMVLDKPSSFPVEKQARNEKGMEELERSEMGRFGSSSSSSRVVPKNPRLAVYGGTLDDITFFFNSGKYNPDAAQKSQGTGKLFTKEEKALLNQRIPNLAAATSDKWQPLHTLVASGEFYLVNALLKHNVDINAVDKDGLTALHRAILGKKQAIFNYLLRESANPFVREKDGATLMHYAVRTASSPMIKILLLYNVNINLQDDEGWTPLHLAVQSRRTDIVRLLLIKGADKTIKNRDGLTPVELCLYCGRDTKTNELLKLLKKKYKKRY